jgi:hypothetical protein
LASTDRPSYEHVLRQRNELERIANQLIGYIRIITEGGPDSIRARGLVADQYQSQMDEIIATPKDCQSFEDGVQWDV